MKRTVYCIGETVLDILFRDGTPVASRPGGSMLNSAVSLGRAGIEVHFIGETGDDPAGNLIRQFLERNRVGTSLLRRIPGEKTTLSLAFLDPSGEATYSFYTSNTLPPFNPVMPDPKETDLLLFGSFFSLTSRVRTTLIPFLQKAREKGSLLIYDPNFRKPHLPRLEQVLPGILENLSLSDIVRGSDEDFIHIFAAGSPGDLRSMTGFPEELCLIFTRKGHEVSLSCKGTELHVPVPPVRPVSTVGAGDAFNAGVIHSLIRQGITKSRLADLGPDAWKKIAGTGIRFAAEVCSTLDNYIPEAFASGLEK